MQPTFNGGEGIDFTCAAPANATATCSGGACGFTGNSGYEAHNGGCFQIVTGPDQSVCAQGCGVFRSVDGSGNLLCATGINTPCGSTSDCPTGTACYLSTVCLAPC